MVTNPYTKALWDARRSVLAWAVAVAGICVMYAAFYPSISKPAFADAMASYPESIKKALDFQDVTSPAGYLGSTAFGLLGPILLVVFTIIVGSRAIAGDEEAGTLDLVLAHPVGRTRLALYRLAALGTQILVICAVTLALLLAISGPAKLSPIGTGNLAAASLHLATLGICFAALTLAVGAGTGRRSVAVGVATVVAVLGFFANNLAPSVRGLGWAQTISPFHYYSGGQPLLHGVRWADLGILVAAGAVVTALGLVAFDRRDLAV